MRTLSKALLFLLCLQTSWLLQTQQPTTIFCHGIIDTKDQIDRYANFIEAPKITFNFPDAQQPIGWSFNNLLYLFYSMIRNQPLNREKMYMGYGQDVEALKNMINPDGSYILFGFSRGGTAIINYLANNNIDNIKAVVLNAVPADIIQSVDDVQKKLGYTFAPTRFDQEYFFNMLFPAYPIGSTASKDLIAQIKNKHLPIFIAHAKTDTIVSISAAWQLYTAFLQAGFTDIYLCELASGQHKAYPQSPDKITFLQGLHSFYKKYHFNYNHEFATLHDLSSLQPTVDSIAP